MKKLAEEPVPLELIKLNFDARRKKEHENIQRSESDIKQLERISKDYISITMKIEIMNCFNLIYMIKIRQNAFGTSEYLQLEKQIKEGAALETDESLEKAMFKSVTGEQQTLF